MNARRPASLPKPAHSRAVTRRVLRVLEAQHPGAFTALTFRNAYELLAATILSAQCTDERVNQEPSHRPLHGPGDCGAYRRRSGDA